MKSASVRAFHIGWKVVLEMNLDIPKLTRVRYVMHDSEELEKQIAWQRERLYNISQRYSGMPHGGAPKGMDDIFGEIEELEAEQRAKLREYTQVYREADRIISSIHDDELRLFATLAYIKQLPGATIRRIMHINEKKLRYMRECIEMAKCMALVKSNGNEKCE